MNFFSFLYRRSKYHWLLLLTLIFGIILASAFLASGPVLIDTLLEYGLRRTLLNANSKEDIFHLTLRETSDEDQYLRIDDHISKFIDDRVSQLEIDLIPTGNVRAIIGELLVKFHTSLLAI